MDGAAPLAGSRRRGPGAGSGVLGLDEAGRGSVLGPLVLGGFHCDARAARELRSIGVRDSKLLTRAKREELFGRLPSLGSCLSRELAPRSVDAAVRRHRLNGLELEGFAALVQEAGPARVEVDACDVRAERFGARLAEAAEFRGPVESRHRADRDLPIVGAASIVAKVLRDRAIARLESQVGSPIGSGYPSDPRTVEYLRRAAADRSRDLPDGVRRSWATTQRVIRALETPTLETFGR